MPRNPTCGHRGRMTKRAQAASPGQSARSLLSGIWHALGEAQAVLDGGYGGPARAQPPRPCTPSIQAGGPYAKLLEIGELEARFAAVEQPSTGPGRLMLTRTQFVQRLAGTGSPRRPRGRTRPWMPWRSCGRRVWSPIRGKCVWPTTPGDQLLLCHRQAGKIFNCGGHRPGRCPGAPRRLVLLLSRSLRQSGELFRKVKQFYNAVRPAAPVRGHRA